MAIFSRIDYLDCRTKNFTMRTTRMFAFLCTICILILSLQSGYCYGKPSPENMRVLFTDTLPVTQPVSPDKDTSLIFQKAEIEASVDATLWKRNLEKELQPVIEKAARKGMPAGMYTVVIRFLVERDGSISDVQALNDPGYGLAKGAVKALKSGPKWKPGTVNGKLVRSYHSQPISFVIRQG